MPHALLSPSSAPKWLGCLGAVAMEDVFGEPDTGSAHSDLGTAAHFVLSEALQSNQPVELFEGRTVYLVGPDRVATWNLICGDDPAEFAQFEVDTDMVANLMPVVAAVAEYAAGGEVLSEQSLPIGHLTGEKDARGTADVIVFPPASVSGLSPFELQVHDLKYGYGRVRAEGNKQLMIYAIAALDEYADLGPFDRVRLVIHQPRISDKPDEWVVSLDELKAFLAELHSGAKVAMLAYQHRANWVYGPDYSYLTPSEDACQWCRAKARCPKLAAMLQAEVLEVAEPEDFDDLTANAVVAPSPDVVTQAVTNLAHSSTAMLARKLAICDLLEDWIKAVRAAVERHLLAGDEVPGYKLVQGKKGHRKWGNADEAEAALKTFRLKVEEMYDLSLISPTTAEKLAKVGTIGPRQWGKLQDLITQSEGKLSVAPTSDKRPAVKLDVSGDFADDTDGSDMV